MHLLVYLPSFSLLDKWIVDLCMHWVDFGGVEFHCQSWLNLFISAVVGKLYHCLTINCFSCWALCDEHQNHPHTMSSPLSWCSRWQLEFCVKFENWAEVWIWNMEDANFMQCYGRYWSSSCNISSILGPILTNYASLLRGRNALSKQIVIILNVENCIVTVATDTFWKHTVAHSGGFHMLVWI